MRPRHVIVDYDPLPAVLTAADALAPDAPLLFPEHGSNVCFGTTFPEGDDSDPLDGADVVAEVTMVSQRLAGVPMETNGILAVPKDGGLTLLGLAPGAARDPRRVRGRCSASTRRSCASCARGSAAASGPRRRRTSST